MSGPIEALRQAAFDQLSAGLPQQQVHRYLPDDVGVIPFVAVGRPGLNQSDQLPGQWQLDLNIYVVGNRTNSAGHQRDHDVLADQVLAALGNSAPVAPVVECGVVSVTAAVTPIANQDYPTYVVNFVGYTNINC